ELYLRDFLFLIVPGDTLYQTGAVKDGVSEYNFQLKNPKSEKMKSYIIYGNEGDITSSMTTILEDTVNNYV
ncbi:hypothetical protein NOA42_09830, partial [Streptococcus thermophilus]|nr:hypothetical protein [Streptococcus thermophilus]